MAKEPKAAKVKPPAETGAKSETVKITMKVSGTFTGAVSKIKFTYTAYDVLEVSPEDIVHLDKADYLLGSAPKPAQESKKK